MIDQDKREILAAIAAVSAQVTGVEGRLAKIERIVTALAQSSLGDDELRALGLLDHADGRPYVAPPISAHPR
jgi:hypothetical protein